MKEHFDYVVVGAGSAGCVIAGRLSEAGFTVCVLEAGPNDKNRYIQIPAGYIKNVFDPKITWGSKAKSFLAPPSDVLINARTRCRRFQFDQRHDLQSRTGARL